ncbi:trypsin-like peptidase domain-containing protein [Cupriavidus plantarum]|uniref:trypsin-like peptidase domain-containing protein n=1 Tax=Cupriavidus plantarum TaxID=942865 RepID=UPI0015CE54D9
MNLPPILIDPLSVGSVLLRPMFNDLPLAAATGFIVQGISGQLLITNRHVVTGRDNQTELPLDAHASIPNRIAITHVSAVDPIAWTETIEDLYLDENDETPRWIEHPHWKNKADVVALPLSVKGVKNVAPYDIGAMNADILVGPTAGISVIGFPFGKTASDNLAIWSTGFMASEHGANYENLPVFLISCHTRSGQSGSPVVAYRTGSFLDSAGSFAITNGRVVRFLGVYSGRIHRDSDIGMVWKKEVVHEIITAAGYQNPKPIAIGGSLTYKTGDLPSTLGLSALMPKALK